jgi:hypothetical protein
MALRCRRPCRRWADSSWPVLAHAPALCAWPPPRSTATSAWSWATCLSGTSWAPALHCPWSQQPHALLRTLPGVSNGGCPTPAPTPTWPPPGLIAAGLDGIERALECPPPLDDDLFALTLSEIRARGIPCCRRAWPRHSTPWRADSVRHGAGRRSPLSSCSSSATSLDYARHVSDWELGATPRNVLTPSRHARPTPWAGTMPAWPAAWRWWAATSDCLKLLVASFPVFLLAWLRFGIAAVAMAALGAPARRRATGWTPHERRLLFWESFLGNFLFSICMLYGVWLTSAVSAGVVMAACPAAVALLSRLFLGERMPRRSMAGTACAVAGIAALACAQASRRTHRSQCGAVHPADWPGWAPALLLARCSARPAMW